MPRARSRVATYSYMHPRARYAGSLPELGLHRRVGQRVKGRQLARVANLVCHISALCAGGRAAGAGRAEDPPLPDDDTECRAGPRRRGRARAARLSVPSQN